MARKKQKWLYNEQVESIIVDGQAYPLKIIKESRRDVRSSVGKDAIYLRVPYWSSNKEIEKLKDWCIGWIEKKQQQKDVLASLRKTHISNGFEIILPKETLKVSISHASRKSGRGQIFGNIIGLLLPYGMEMEEEQEFIRKMINNLLGKKYQRVLEARVHSINERSFKQEIKSIKLRYNYSKWGSCSSNQNISLSTRLIFCPDEVIDYVIVHELAHMIEFNHSEKFWNIVEQVMPNYKEYELWLKENASKCDY